MVELGGLPILDTLSSLWVKPGKSLHVGAPGFDGSQH